MKDSDYIYIQSWGKDNALQVRQAGSDCEVLLVGSKERLIILEHGDEYIVSDDEWHEHCDGIAEVCELLSRLLTGSNRIAVKYRGKIPVGHQLQSVDEGRITVLRQSGILLSPFWLKKRYSIIEYSPGKKRVRFK